LERGRTSLFMHELLEKLAPGSTVLDLGCGNGSFRYADFAALKIYALDQTEPAKLDEFPPNVEFRQSAAEVLPYSDETFDLVIGNFVFEHVADFPAALLEAERVLKVGGLLYMSVPNSRSFEDDLYRALFAGGGHLQRHTFESIMHQVYRHTDLKLISYADWPAGFTFWEEHEALRTFVFSVVESAKRSSGLDLRARSNYIFLFRREEGLGYRQVARVCTYCGSGNGIDQPVEAADAPWQCRSCGRENRRGTLTLGERERIEQDMRALWRRYPHLQPLGYGQHGTLEEIKSLSPQELEELRRLAWLSHRLRNSKIGSLVSRMVKRWTGYSV
jgi:ubiquinone/menaquinone biosynthesis C-methylase UbiE